jgi:ABC-type transporter Mla subunit MlaD
VGSITGLSLDQRDYKAVIETKLRDDLALPVDSRAAVASSALGGPYLSITPGHAAKTVPQGGELRGELGGKPAS